MIYVYGCVFACFLECCLCENELLRVHTHDLCSFVMCKHVENVFEHFSSNVNDVCDHWWR